MLLLLTLLFGFAFGLEVCPRWNIRLPDPYGAQLVKEKITEYLLESGLELSCKEGSKALGIEVSSKERGLSISPRQRVSTYLLTLKVKVGGESFSASVPYSQSSGGLGELPRREALAEALQRLKLQLIDYFFRIQKDEGRREDKEGKGGS